MTEGNGLYRYTVRQFNNMLLDPLGFDIYEKYTRLGLQKLEPYLPEFSSTLLKLCDIMSRRRNKLLLSLLTITICYSTLPLIITRKTFRCF